MVTEYNVRLFLSNIQGFLLTHGYVQCGIHDRKHCSKLFDPFEPNWMSETYLLYPVLGEMTFGKEKWVEMRRKRPFQNYMRSMEEFEDFAVKAMKRNPFTGGYITIDITKFDDLYVEEDKMKAKQCKTIFFRVDGKEFWSTFSGPP